MLPTNNQVPIENVVVAESGDDSEDEWNYIKVDKEKPEQEKTEDRETPNVELESEHDIEPSKEVAEGDITSPTPPTASLGETDFINQQSHAIAQAFAQPEEACSEVSAPQSNICIFIVTGKIYTNTNKISIYLQFVQLLEEKQDSEHPELFDLEHVERSSSVAAEHDSDLGNDQDLEDMENSQLNPDAKEFIPVSPQHTSIGSPFGNGGGIHNRLDLMDDDVVSQSPRKGTAIVMDDVDIVLPAENDFTEISQRPSELLASELKFDSAVPNENGNLLNDDTAVKDVPRPESSSSQCSYQEMNLKEAMHGDEKQELAAEVHEENPFSGSDGIVPNMNGEPQPFMSERDPMNMSFYNDENNPFSSGEVDMNAVQRLPDYIEDDVQENEIDDFVSQPADLHVNQENNFGEFGEDANLKEADEKPTPITNFVQELATEVTSILNEFDQQGVEKQVADEKHQQIDTENVSQSEIGNEGMLQIQTKF